MQWGEQMFNKEDLDVRKQDIQKSFEAIDDDTFKEALKKNSKVVFVMYQRYRLLLKELF